MRKLPNFIDGFLRYTDGKGSPELFRLWTAIFLVGAAMERKCWMRTAKGQWFPNQYLLLVGDAGVGKSLCTSLAYGLLEEMRSPEQPFHIAPTSVTKASLVDALAAAERRVVRPMENPAVNQFNSVTIIPNEFGVFLHSWEGDFMATLTDLWDNGRYAETRRTSKINIDIRHGQLSLFSATTPAHLQRLLPEGAWEEGFMSRCLIVYSGEIIYTDIFMELDDDAETRKNLVADLRNIYSNWGQFELTEGFRNSYTLWMKSGAQPKPDHPKLQSYNIRRGSHLLKFAMIASMAESSSLVVSEDHFHEALNWMIQLESFMPDVFKSLKTGGDSAAMEECWHYAYQYWMKYEKPLDEHMIVRFLQERVPVHSIERIIDIMVRGKLLEKQFLNTGGQGYKPMARRAA